MKKYITLVLFVVMSWVLIGANPVKAVENLPVLHLENNSVNFTNTALSKNVNYYILNTTKGSGIATYEVTINDVSLKDQHNNLNIIPVSFNRQKNTDTMDLSEIITDKTKVKNYFTSSITAPTHVGEYSGKTVVDFNVTKIDYTITFDDMVTGIIKDSEKTRIAEGGTKIGDLPVPTVKEGYRFEGWYENLFIPEYYSPSSGITSRAVTWYIDDEDFVYTQTNSDSYIGYAGFNKVNHSESSGFGPLIEIDPTKDFSFLLTNPSFSRNYFVFWDENEDIILNNTGKQIDNASLDNYFWHIDSNIGTIIPPSNARYVSFRFGPHKETNGTTMRTKILLKAGGPTFEWVSYYKKANKDDIVNANTQYFARYTKANTITYNLDGGEFALDAKKYYYSDDEDYTLPIPEKPGYTFLGWTGSNGTTPEKTVVISKNSTGDKSYAANWQQLHYDITYASKDLIKADGVSEYCNASCTAKEENNWLTVSNDVYTIHTEQNYYGLVIDTTFDQDKNYLLEYDIQKVNGTLFNIGGHAQAAQDQIFKIDDIVSETAYSTRVAGISNISNDTKIHHISLAFKYHYTTGEPYTQIYIQPNRFNGIENHLTAKVFNIHLNEIFKQDSKVYGETLGTLPTAPTKSGYTFLGWFTEEDGGVQVTSTTEVTGSMTLYPRYVEKAKTLYSISYRNMTDTDNYPTQAVEGTSLSLNMNDKKYEAFKVYVDNKEITNFTYKDYILTIPNITGNIIIMYSKFDYCGTTDGMLLYADYNNSNSTRFGDLKPTSGTLTYNADKSLKLSSSTPTLQYNFDASMDLSNEYTIVTTVKGPSNQEGQTAKGFAATIVAVSYADGQYLAWLGYYKNYFNYLSYSTEAGRGQIAKTEKGTGYSAFGISDYNNKTVTIIVTSKRGGLTKVFFNGKLMTTFTAGSSSIGYEAITINDLRNGRNLKFNGSMYDIAFYNRQLTDDEVAQDWACEQTKWTY